MCVFAWERHERVHVACTKQKERESAHECARVLVHARRVGRACRFVCLQMLACACLPACARHGVPRTGLRGGGGGGGGARW